MHVTPRNDLIAHDANPGCICDPRIDADGNIWIHHSLDGREHYEQ